MSDLMQLAAAWFAGTALGAVFFGGLWWTVLKGVGSTRPALWFTGSLLMRTGITLSGFYFIMAGDWRRLLACLCGFVIARLLVTRLLPINGGANSAP